MEIGGLGLSPSGPVGLSSPYSAAGAILNDFGGSSPSSYPALPDEVAESRRSSRRGSKTGAESLGAKAVRFSKAYNMTFNEAKEILEAFDNTSKDSSARFCKRDLQSFLCNLFHAKEIPEATLSQIYLRTCSSDGFDMDAFFAWHMCSFSTVAQLKGDKAAVMKGVELDAICAKQKIDANGLDKIRRVFDKFDTDGSGELDKDEFELMICVYMGAKKADISKDRLSTWWREIDVDGSGLVEFPEFVEWYVKYFGSANSLTPTQAFYASFNPSVQRMKYMSVADES